VPSHDDDWAELDEREYPEPDSDSNGFAETVPCPSCRAQIYEESERCPRCGTYISREDSSARRPLWFVIAALLCLAVALAWAVWG
jgi:uncharacterized paraquat-inducible protein A